MNPFQPRISTDMLIFVALFVPFQQSFLPFQFVFNCIFAFPIHGINLPFFRHFFTLSVLRIGTIYPTFHALLHKRLEKQYYAIFSAKYLRKAAKELNQVIAIVNGKGRVSKATTTVNLASLFVNRARK